MKKCDHSERFTGVFGLDRECHGCLACHAERLAEEVARLKRRETARELCDRLELDIKEQELTL